MILMKIKKVQRLILLLILIFSLILLPECRMTANVGWLADWANRITLTVDHTKVGETLTNFPILVSLSSSSGTASTDISLVFNELSDNGTKIAVTTADGTTQCYVEIERWDSVNRQACLWVRVPSISSSTDTTLYLYYDRVQADNTGYVGYTGSTAAQAVWDTNFVAAYHLAQQGNGTVGEVKDSTAKQHNGQGMGSPVPARTEGIGGSYAQLFDGVSRYPNGNFIKVPDNRDFSQPATGYLMISFWLNPTTLDFQTYDDGGNHYVRIINKAESGALEYHMVMYSNSSTYTNAGPGTLVAYAYGQTTGHGAGAGMNYPGIVQAGRWTYFTILYSPTGVTNWVNAPPYTAWGEYSAGFTKRYVTYSQTPEGSTVVMADTNASLAIGAGSALGNNGYYTGKFDEIRFSNVARSEAWIKASFYSEMDQLIRFKITKLPTSSDYKSEKDLFGKYNILLNEVPVSRR